MVYAWPGMVLATMFVTVPFVVREVVPVLREFGVDQEEVARTLGAGRWRTFWQVTLPSIRWGLAYGVTLTVARSLGEFGALLVVSGNILGRTQTATLYIHDTIEGFHPEGAYAASVALAGVSFVLLIGMELLRKRVERHETGEGEYRSALTGRQPTAIRLPYRRLTSGDRGSPPVASGSATFRPSTTSRSRSPRGSSSPCWGRRGRARARSCGSSPGWSRPTRARSR